jgi:hypothetical protein
MPVIDQVVEFEIGSDKIVRMELAGTGSIAGQQYRAVLWDARRQAGYLLASEEGLSSVSIYDPIARLVDWRIARDDWPADLREGTFYEWAIWRDEPGYNVPLAAGPGVLVRIPGA